MLATNQKCLDRESVPLKHKATNRIAHAALYYYNYYRSPDLVGCAWLDEYSDGVKLRHLQPADAVAAHVKDAVFSLHTEHCSAALP